MNIQALQNNPNLHQLEIIKEWIFKLGLEDSKLIFNFTEKEYLYDRIEASCSYSADLGKWVLYFGNNVDQFALIHEIGHIYFSKLTHRFNYSKLDKKDGKLFDTSEWKKSPIQEIHNIIEDVFVNYRLSKYPGFYSELLKKYPKDGKLVVDDIAILMPFLGHLGIYIYLFLHFNSIMKQSDRQTRKNDIKYNLKIMRELAFKKAKQEKKRFSYQTFQKLDLVLKQFDKVKNTMDYKTVIKFTYKVLMTLGFWDKKEIISDFQRFFFLQKRG